MALDGAREALANRGAGDIHLLAYRENGGSVKRVARFHAVSLNDGELGQ